MAPFYGWGSTASSSRLVPLQGGSLLLTTKFPDIHVTHFIDLRRMKGLEPPSGFEHGTPGLVIQRLNHLQCAMENIRLE